MKIIEFLRNKLILRKQLLLKSPKNLYRDFISEKKIDDIINNTPKNLDELEKAYYIYLELGKILKENPDYVFADEIKQSFTYKNRINDKYYGICKSISELYVNILKDKRIGIKADLVNIVPQIGSHVDVILKIGGKNYIINLIEDLSRIQTSRKTYGFGFKLDKDTMNEEYVENLEKYYGKIDYLNREQIEQMDKKMGYSFVSNLTNKNERGIYTNDVIELIKKDMENPETFKKYVLHGKDVPKEEHLKYKIDYIFENIDKITDYTTHPDYLENVRYYLYIARKILTPMEREKIDAFVATEKYDYFNLISILKMNQTNKKNGENNNIYYLYSKEDRKYIQKSPEEMKQFIDGLDKDSLKIVGTFDKYEPREIDELEL